LADITAKAKLLHHPPIFPTLAYSQCARCIAEFDR